MFTQSRDGPQITPALIKLASRLLPVRAALEISSGQLEASYAAQSESPLLLASTPRDQWCKDGVRYRTRAMLPWLLQLPVGLSMATKKG
ncbi:hypothetical protein ETAA8_69500 [Anatilimnocola aggregata]|uniref:Uncharacterized protein n=1 Tax=Anatilimnocola aggregata TaxID=2528021 RepID=A0A517YNK8_9BACT|nr:hypothetical protein ETAA8_69500 [Anatilimnocola aggregata]